MSSKGNQERDEGMQKKLIQFGCALVYWGCLVAAGVLYGALAVVIVLVSASATAMGTTLSDGKGDNNG